MRENILVFYPFAYMHIFEDVDTVQTKRSTYDVKKLFWRFYRLNRI